MKTINTFFLSLLLGTGIAAATQSVERSVPAAANATIEIENLAGSVVVRGWSQDEVKVSGRLGDDVEGLTIDRHDDRIEIEVEIPEGRHHRKIDVTSHLEIWVPEGSRLEVETVSASIDVIDLTNQVELSSISGNIEVKGQLQEAELETVSGDLRVEGLQTRVSAETVGGEVHLRGIAGSVEVSTVNGDAEIYADEVDRADFETVSGNVRFTGRLGASAQVDVESHSGDVVLTLPADVSASFQVETFSGDIENGFGPPAKRSSRYTPEKRLEFSTGSWDARISIESFSGNVILARQ